MWSHNILLCIVISDVAVLAPYSIIFAGKSELDILMVGLGNCCDVHAIVRVRNRNSGVCNGTKYVDFKNEVILVRETSIDLTYSACDEC